MDKSKLKIHEIMLLQNLSYLLYMHDTKAIDQTISNKGNS